MTPSSDGTTASRESVDLTPLPVASDLPPPEPSPPPPPPAAESVAAAPLEPPPKQDINPSSPDKDFLKQLGMTKRVAMRMLANGKSESYLNTKITARVMLVNHANGVEQIMMAQRKANLMGKDKGIDPRTRCACLSVVAQCGMALARLSEVALATARNLDQPDENGESKVVKPTQNNYFGFPPVATSPNRAIEASATTGGA